MEALGFPSNTHSISCSSSQKRRATKPPSQGTNFSSISSPSSLKLTPSYRSYHFRRSATRMQVDSEGYELKQMRDMAAAKKRWEALVCQKTHIILVICFVHVINLIFIVCFFNSRFVAKVSEKFPEDTDLIIACQKGLRSRAACEQLYNTGYKNLFWVQGGAEAAEEEDLVREGPLPFKFAGIGGLSEFLGTGSPEIIDLPRITILEATVPQKEDYTNQGKGGENGKENHISQRKKGNRGLATTIRLSILCIVIPKTSARSKSLAVVPGGSSQSKLCRS